MANIEMNVLKVGDSEFEIADAQARQDCSELKDDFYKLNEVIIPRFDESPYVGYSIYKSGNKYVIGKAKNIPASKVYVKPDNPTNGSGSESNPFNNIVSAFRKCYSDWKGYTIVVLKPTNGNNAVINMNGYCFGDNSNDNRFKIAITTETDDYRILCTNGQNQTFTLHDGSVYKTTVSDAVGAFDISNKDSNGCIIPLNKVDSIDDLSANSYFVDGTTLYVQTYDSRTPDSSIFVCSDGAFYNYINLIGNGEFYCKNVDFLYAYTTANRVGFKASFYVYSTAKKGTAWFDNCNFIGSTSAGVEVMDTCAIFENCVCAYNMADGLAYDHSGMAVSSGIGNPSLEVRCKSYENGTSGSITSNASTCHKNSCLIRIECEGFNCYGPIFADVGNSHVMNIGCNAHDSLASSNNDAYQTDGDSNLIGYLYLIDCYAYGSIRNSVLAGVGSGNANAYISGLKSFAPRVASSGSVITEY